MHFRQRAEYLKGVEEEGGRRERGSGGERAHTNYLGNLVQEGRIALFVCVQGGGKRGLEKKGD